MKYSRSGITDVILSESIPLSPGMVTHVVESQSWYGDTCSRITCTYMHVVELSYLMAVLGCGLSGGWAEWWVG